MRMRCNDCGLVFDHSGRAADCPHEELPARANSDGIRTDVRDFLADASVPEI